MENLLGIDFEEWYHIELVQHHVSPAARRPSVINSIDKILDWLRKNDTFATFFMVGDLLKMRPDLLDKVVGEGHEIAFHTMNHTRLDSPSYGREQFDHDIKEFQAITSNRSRGFRAPSFSLSPSTSWAIDVLSQNNYTYDSSIVPAKTRLYGVPNAERKPYKISSSAIEKNDPSASLLEFPLLTTRFFGKSIPAAGGFYLRLLPIRFIEKAIFDANRRRIPAVFYIHSWELAPEYLPKIELPMFSNFITYFNIGKALFKIDNLFKNFEFTSFDRYMNSTSQTVSELFHLPTR